MLKRRKPKGSGIIRNPDRTRSPAHRAWVRGFKCLCDDGHGGWCDGPIECAHVRTGTDGGTGIKPSDIWCVPLCRRHHQQQHQRGEAKFERDHVVNLKFEAERLAAQSPALRRLAHERRILEEELGA